MFWGWLRKHLHAMDLADAVQKKPLLSKAQYIRRFHRVLKTKKAQRMVGAYARNFRAVCKEVKRKSGAASSKWASMTLEECDCVTSLWLGRFAQKKKQCKKWYWNPAVPTTQETPLYPQHLNLTVLLPCGLAASPSKTISKMLLKFRCAAPKVFAVSREALYVPKCFPACPPLHPIDS